MLGKGITFPPVTTTFTFGIPQEPKTTASTTISTSIEKFTLGQNTTTTTSAFSSNSNGFTFSAPKLNLGVNPTSSATPPTIKFTFGTPKLESTTSGSAVKPISEVSDSNAQSLKLDESKSSVSSSTTGGFVFGMPSTGTTTSPFSQLSSGSSSFFSLEPSGAKTNAGNIFGGTPLKKTEEQTVPTSSSLFIEKEKPNESSSISTPLFDTPLKLETKGKLFLLELAFSIFLSKKNKKKN